MTMLSRWFEGVFTTRGLVPDARDERPTTRARHRQRGATMVSVMLLTVSMLTVGVLVVRSASRQLDQANASASRDRALLSAQGAVELAAGQYRQLITGDQNALDVALAGNVADAAGSPDECSLPTRSCIPGAGTTSPRTGQKNAILTNRSDCGGRPCMRQGAVVRLRDRNLAIIPWVNTPMRDLIEGGDPEARVWVWVRNNASDALGDGSDAAGLASWTNDTDGRIVITAMATVRNTTVAIEQEILLSPGATAQTWQMASPDEQYGGSHNNDNAAVEVCKDNYLSET